MERTVRLSPSLERLLVSLAGLEEEDSAGLVSRLHAFVELYVRERFPELGPTDSYPELLRAFSRRLGVQRPEDLRTIGLLIEEHEVFRRLDRSAGRYDPEEALAARHNFLRFCALCGIETGVLKDIARPLLAWNERKTPTGGGSERERLQYEILDSQTSNGNLLARSAEWARDKQRLAELEGEALRLRVERDRLGMRGETGKERAAALDRELEECDRQKGLLAQRLETYRELDRYVLHVSRFSLYTRTRMDYERGLIRLTPEQEEAAEAVRPGRDFLIRGGAGTGKTIVLLHAFGATVHGRAGELALHPRAPILFLTYTRTLVKYDRYIAEILREPGAAGEILTIDSFFQDRLKLLGKQQKIDYTVVPRLAGKLNVTGFFSAQELAVEIEDFIFANMVTRREYVDERIPRRGMRQPLSAGQRETVWKVRERMVEAMEHDGILSRNYSRLVLIDHLEADPEDASSRDVDLAFVDESQDLTAGDLHALKLMSRRGLIMAGTPGRASTG